MNKKKVLHNLLDDLTTLYRIVVNDKDKVKLSKYHQALNDFLIEYEILQSKIDKAIDKLNKRYEEDKKIFRGNYDFKFILDFEEELLNDLKEEI